MNFLKELFFWNSKTAMALDWRKHPQFSPDILRKSTSDCLEYHLHNWHPNIILLHTMLQTRGGGWNKTRSLPSSIDAICMTFKYWRGRMLSNMPKHYILNYLINQIHTNMFFVCKKITKTKNHHIWPTSSSI